AGFVLERDKDHAARGVGPLPAGDQPGYARGAAVGAEAEFFRREELKPAQTASQQRERVAAESQPEAGVVGDDVLAFARRLEPRQALGRRRIERRPAPGARSAPVREAPMTGERAQRSGGRQAAQILAIQIESVNRSVRPARGKAFPRLLR